jgi:hypothetical protein
MVAALLASVSSSDIVCSDVNVRFPSLEYQYSTPGLRSCLTTFRTWLDGDASLAHLSPEREIASASISCESHLNLDYCFVQRAFRDIHLSLLSTKHLSFDSDYKYALSFVLGGYRTPEPTSPGCDPLDLPRYRIQSLNDPRNSLALSSA